MSNRQNPNQNHTIKIKIKIITTIKINEPRTEFKPITISVASRRALDLLKKSRANRSAFMIIEPNQTIRLQFDPTKSNLEKKTFNGQTTERIAHTVVNVDDRAAGEKVLSHNIQTKSASRRSNGARIYSHGYHKNRRRI